MSDFQENMKKNLLSNLIPGLKPEPEAAPNQSYVSKDGDVFEEDDKPAYKFRMPGHGKINLDMRKYVDDLTMPDIPETMRRTSIVAPSKYAERPAQGRPSYNAPLKSYKTSIRRSDGQIDLLVNPENNTAMMDDEQLEALVSQAFMSFCYTLDHYNITVPSLKRLNDLRDEMRGLVHSAISESKFTPQTTSSYDIVTTHKE